MKKITKVLLLFAVAIGLAGCVKYNINMSVGEDRSFSLDFIYAMDTSAFDSLGNSTTSEETTSAETEESSTDGVNKDEYDWLKEKGYTVSEYTNKENDKNYVGVKLSKKFNSIDDVTKAEDKVIDINKIYKSKEDFDDSQFFSKSGNTYKASLVFDFTEESTGEESSSEGTADMSSMMAGMFDMTYTITLPVKPLTNNATSFSEDGKTLTWTLEYGKKNEVNYTFELANTGTKASTGSNGSSDSTEEAGFFESNKTLIIGAGVVVLILIIFLASRRKNKFEAVSQNNVVAPEMNNNESTEAIAPTVEETEPQAEQTQEEPVQEETTQENNDTNLPNE